MSVSTSVDGNYIHFRLDLLYFPPRLTVRKLWPFGQPASSVGRRSRTLK